MTTWHTRTTAANVNLQHIQTKLSVLNGQNDLPKDFSIIISRGKLYFSYFIAPMLTRTMIKEKAVRKVQPWCDTRNLAALLFFSAKIESSSVVQSRKYCWDSYRIFFHNSLNQNNAADLPWWNVAIPVFSCPSSQTSFICLVLCSCVHLRFFASCRGKTWKFSSADFHLMWHQQRHVYLKAGFLDRWIK